MENSEEGSEILKSQPRINSNTIDLEKLKHYPEGTLGKAYSNFLEINVSLIVIRVTYFCINNILACYSRFKDGCAVY